MLLSSWNFVLVIGITIGLAISLLHWFRTKYLGTAGDKFRVHPLSPGLYLDPGYHFRLET